MHGLVAYGHSWVGGAGASHPDRAFVALVAERLGLGITNRGVGGSSSTDTADLLSCTPAPPSELYLLMTGLNDARLYGTSSSALQAYAAALETIFMALARASPTAHILALEQPHLLDYSMHAPHDLGSDQVLDAYNTGLRAVACNHPVVRLAPVVGWDATTMLDEDTVHPNDGGHAQLAEAAVDALDPR